MTNIKNLLPCRTLRAAAAASILSALVWLAASSAVSAQPIKIVAVGASNTKGWGVGVENSFSSQLGAKLRARGYHVEIHNAGVPGSRTHGMLERLDHVVPDRTHLVILQPGSNDLRFFGSKEQRAANVAEIVRRLRARKIPVVVYDRDVPSNMYQWDGIHFTVAGHALIAERLLPEVTAMLATKSRTLARQ
jgi:acyl-CoA thioesterase-1